VFSMGYGMSAASDGRWFPWVFTPTKLWSQAPRSSAHGSRKARLDKLKGKKIAHISTTVLRQGSNPTLEDLGKSMASS